MEKWRDLQEEKYPWLTNQPSDRCKLDRIEDCNEETWRISAWPQYPINNVTKVTCGKNKDMYRN